jgi:hypothetical protein
MQTCTASWLDFNTHTLWHASAGFTAPAARTTSAAAAKTDTHTSSAAEASASIPELDSKEVAPLAGLPSRRLAPLVGIPFSDRQDAEASKATPADPAVGALLGKVNVWGSPPSPEQDTLRASSESDDGFSSLDPPGARLSKQRSSGAAAAAATAATASAAVYRPHRSLYDGEVNLSSSLDVDEDEIAVEIDEEVGLAEEGGHLGQQQSKGSLRQLVSMDMREASLSASDRSGHLDAIISQQWSVGKPDFVEGVDEQ